MQYQDAQVYNMMQLACKAKLIDCKIQTRAAIVGLPITTYACTGQIFACQTNMCKDSKHKHVQGIQAKLTSNHCAKGLDTRDNYFLWVKNYMLAKLQQTTATHHAHWTALHI